MEDITNSDTHLTSAAAFVEGGIQEACDDACSICLEAFSDADPSTVTCCKHEFHLQCILEWCQRSSQCPMCWQPISLKDPASQELLEGVEQERNIRLNMPRTAAIFRHPTLGDFELQHLPIGENDTELEERIIQHLAAAAAMGRTHRISRREGQRSRSSAQGRPQVLVFSTHPNTTAAGSTAFSPASRGEDEPAPVITAAGLSSPSAALGEETSQFITPSPSASGSTVLSSDQCRSPIRNCSSTQSLSSSQDVAGPSELQSFSESVKSRFNSMSARYKESISKSTKVWKERWFSRNSSIADLGSEVKREVNVGIATVSRMIERLETRDASRARAGSMSDGLDDSPVADTGNQQISETGSNNSLSDNSMQAVCQAGSGSN